VVEVEFSVAVEGICVGSRWRSRVKVKGLGSRYRLEDIVRGIVRGSRFDFEGIYPLLPVVGRGSRSRSRCSYEKSVSAVIPLKV